jgi:mannose-6-phosphate isomerase
MAEGSGSAALKDEGSTTAAPELVTLRPRLVERVWGAMELPAYLEQPQPGRPIGEAWLTATECVAEEQGMTLGGLARRWPAAFGADEKGEFPLLIKLLFPREKLSVQVHPNDEEARAIGQPRGKSECWYVLSAEPRAEIALGFREELTRGEMERAIQERRLEETLQYVKVKAGDMVYVEAGTIHAIGPGMVVLETQQYSDTTYRLYDYGRPRELHLKQGLAVTKSKTSSGLVSPVSHERFTTLVSSPYFEIDRFKLSAREERRLGGAEQMQILIATCEGAAVRLTSQRTVALSAGHAAILPANADAGEHVLVAGAEAEVIRVTAGPTR